MHARQEASLTLLLSVAATCIGQSANAQSIWMPPTTHSQIQIEAIKSSYSEDRVGFWTSAWYPSGLARLSPATALYLEVPFAMYAPEGSEIQTTFGNPYIGIVYGSVDQGGFVMEAGGRLPTLSDENLSEKAGAIVTGWTSDYSRFEAFAPSTIALKLRVGACFVRNAHRVTVFKIMLGDQAWIPTGDRETEMVADVDMGLWNMGPEGSVGAVISTKTLLTTQDLSFSERSEFQLGLTGSLRFGQAEPGIHVRLPLGNNGAIGLGKLVDVVLGVNCTVHLSK